MHLSTGGRSGARAGGMVRLLFIGDIVGERAVAAVRALVPELRSELQLDAVIANGENSAGGAGITAETGVALLSVADFLTLGDHAFDRDGAGEFLDLERRVVRPANLKGELPGRGWGIFEAGGGRIGVANLQGRVFMREAGSPFEAADRAVEELEAAGADLMLVDVHAEATSEKQALGWHLQGRACAVVGTHTHVPTADLRVLPGGTAYVSDVGMVGAEGIIGMDRKAFMGVFFRGERRSVFPAEGPVGLDAVLIEADPATGRASGIGRVHRRWDE